MILENSSKKEVAEKLSITPIEVDLLLCEKETRKKVDNFCRTKAAETMLLLANRKQRL